MSGLSALRGEGNGGGFVAAVEEAAMAGLGAGILWGLIILAIGMVLGFLVKASLGQGNVE